MPCCQYKKMNSYEAKKLTFSRFELGRLLKHKTGICILILIKVISYEEENPPTNAKTVLAAALRFLLFRFIFRFLFLGSLYCI